MTRRHVILAGLPGSGKTTAGALAAAALGAPFVDLDPLIERRAGRSVSRIFAEDGEGGFRELERAVGAEVLAGPPAVVAPGGGYVVDPSARELARRAGLLIYLSTSPEVAARRLSGSASRPLVPAGDAASALASLLRAREAAYLDADEVVTTDSLTAEQVAARVAELARRRGGW